MTVIRSKKDSFRRMWRGDFGNCLRNWNSYEDAVRECPGARLSVRSVGHGGGLFLHDVPPEKLQEAVRAVLGQAEAFQIIETAPDHRLLIQGEVMRAPGGLDLRYWLRSGVNMREAARRHPGLRATGLTAKTVLETLLDPSSYSDMMELLDRYPDHVIEFSCFDCDVGQIPCRNTLIWEVRLY